MFKLIGRCTVLACILIGAAVTYHQWYGPVVHAVPSLRQYLPAPTAVPQATHVTVAPAPTSTPSAQPTIALSTPSGVPGPALPWSASDCAWALSTMQTDEHLDQQEAWAIAEGFDSRFPLSDEAAYVTWEMDWKQVVADVTSMCSTRVVVNSVLIASDTAHFALAIASHQSDEALIPANSAWDSTWIANYARINALYGELS